MPTPVDFPELGTVEFPDNWSEDQIRAAMPDARAKLVAQREASVTQDAIKESLAQHPEAERVMRIINGLGVTPEEAVTFLSNTIRGGLQGLGSIPQLYGRVEETLPPEAGVSVDEYGNVDLDSLRRVQAIKAARETETPEQRMTRIEANPFTTFGKQVEALGEKIPRDEALSQTFAFGAVPQGLGSMLSSLAAGPFGAAGVYGTTFAQESNDAWNQEMERQKNAGETPDPEKALKKSLLYGSIATAIEAKLGVGSVYRRVLGVFKNAPPVIEEGILNNAPAAIKYIGKELGKESIKGFSEEALQQVAEDVIVDSKINYDNALQSGLVGAIVQGPTALIHPAVHGVGLARQELFRATANPAVVAARAIESAPFQGEFPDMIAANTRGYFPNSPGAVQVDTGPQPNVPSGLVNIQHEPAMPLTPPTVYAPPEEPAPPAPAPPAPERRGPLPNQPSPPRRPLIVPGENEPAPEWIDAISELRRANANTVEKVRALWPQAQLTREQARVWRDRAFPPGYVAPRTEITYTPPETAPEPAPAPTYTPEQLSNPQILASILTNPNLTEDQKRTLIQTGSLPAATAGGPNAGQIQGGVALAGGQPAPSPSQVPAGQPGGLQQPTGRRAPRGPAAPAPTTTGERAAPAPATTPPVAPLTKAEQKELDDLTKQELAATITVENWRRMMDLRAKEWDAIQAQRAAAQRQAEQPRRRAVIPPTAPAPAPAPKGRKKAAKAAPVPVASQQLIQQLEAHAALIGAAVNPGAPRVAQSIAGKTAMSEIAAGTPLGGRIVQRMVQLRLVNPAAVGDFITRVKGIATALQGTQHALTPSAPVPAAPTPPTPGTLPAGTQAPKRRALGARPQAPIVIPELTRTAPPEQTPEGFKLIDELKVDTGQKLTGEERRFARVTTPFIFADPRILVAYQRRKAGQTTTQELRKGASIAEIGQAIVTSGREVGTERSYTRTHLLIFNNNDGLYHMLPVWRNTRGVPTIRENSSEKYGMAFETWAQTARDSGWDFYNPHSLYRVVLNRGNRFINRTFTPAQVQSMIAAVNARYETPTATTPEESATAFGNFIDQLQRGATTPEEAAAEATEESRWLPEPMEIPAKPGARGYIPGGPERPVSVQLTTVPTLSELTERLRTQVVGKQLSKPSQALQFINRRVNSPSHNTRALVKSLLDAADRALESGGFYERYPHANKLQAQGIVAAVALAEASKLAGKRGGSFAAALTGAIERVAQQQSVEPRRGLLTGEPHAATQPTESTRRAIETVRSLGSGIQQVVDSGLQRGVLNSDQAEAYRIRIDNAVVQHDTELLRGISNEVHSVLNASVPQNVKITPEGKWEKLTPKEIIDLKRGILPKTGTIPAAPGATPLQAALSFPELNWTQQKNGTYTAPASIALNNWLRDPSVDNRKAATMLGITFAKDKAGRSIAVAKQIPGTQTQYSLGRLITNPMTVAQVESAVRRILRLSELPKSITVIDNPNTGTQVWRGKVDFGHGQPQITLNAAFLGSESEVKETLSEEAIHIAYYDPQIQDLWRHVMAFVDRERLMSKIFEGYSDSQALNEAANELVREVNKTAEGRSWWQRFLDAIKSFIFHRFGIEWESVDPVVAQKIVARSILLSKGNPAISEAPTQESVAHSLTFIPMSAWPASLRGDTPVDAKSAYGFIRNYFGADSTVWKIIDTPEFRTFMQGQKPGGEILKWVQDHGPQVQVVSYGMAGKASEARKAYDRMMHEWADNLTLHAREQLELYASTTGWDTLDEYESRLKQKLVERAKWPEESAAKGAKYRRLQLEVAQENQSPNSPRATSAYLYVSPKDTAAHPVQRVDVVIPMEQKGVTKRGEPMYRTGDVKWEADNLHEQLPNTVGWAAIQYETVNGQKVAHIFEVQSRWGQQMRDRKARLSEPLPGSPEEASIYAAQRENERKGYEQQNHPLLNDYNRLILKAAIDQARLNGATKIAISDAETAMMTERHDQFGGTYGPTQGAVYIFRADAGTEYVDLGWLTKDNFGRIPERWLKDGRVKGPVDGSFVRVRHDGRDMVLNIGDPNDQWNGQFKGTAEYIANKVARGESSGSLISQEPGMRFNYDEALPRIASELTGDRGTVVDLGEHKNALAEKWLTEQTATGPIRRHNRERFRSDLIFQTPTGEPKTHVTARMYDISNVRPELSLFGRDRAIRPETMHSLVSLPYGFWLSPGGDMHPVKVFGGHAPEAKKIVEQYITKGREVNPYAAMEKLLQAGWARVAKDRVTGAYLVDRDVGNQSLGPLNYRQEAAIRNYSIENQISSYFASMDTSKPIHVEEGQQFASEASGVTKETVNLGSPSGPTQHTAASVLATIANLGGKSRYSALARELMRIGDNVGLGVPVLLNVQSYESPIPRYSYYDPTHDNVTLTVDPLGNMHTDVAIHEIVHALTIAKIPGELLGSRRAGNYGATYLNNLHEFVNRESETLHLSPVGNLVNLYLLTISRFYESEQRRAGAGQQLLRSVGDTDAIDRMESAFGLPYGISSLGEFIAEAFSNPEFQVFLNTDWSGEGQKRTLWRLFLDAIRRILGLSVANESVLESAIVNGAKLMAASRTPIETSKETFYSLVKPANLVFGERGQVQRMTSTPGLEPQQINTIEQVAKAESGLVDQQAAAQIGTWRSGDNADRIAAGVLNPVLKIFGVGGNQLYQAMLEFMPPGMTVSQTDLENRDVAARAVLFVDKGFQQLLEKIQQKRAEASDQLQNAALALPSAQIKEIEASFHAALADELLRGMGEHLRNIADTGRLSAAQKETLQALLTELSAKDAKSKSAIGVALLHVAQGIPAEVLAGTAAVAADGAVVPLGTAGAATGNDGIINWIKAQHSPPVASADEVAWLTTPDATGQSPLQSFTGLPQRLADLQSIVRDREGAMAQIKSFKDWFFANKPKQGAKANQVTLKQFANQYAAWRSQNKVSANLARTIRSDVRKWDDRFRGFSQAADELARMMAQPGYRQSVNEAATHLGASESEISLHEGTGVRYAAKGPLADLSPMERFIDYTPSEEAIKRNVRNAMLIANRIQQWLQTDAAAGDPAAADAWRKEQQFLALHGMMHAAVQANYGQIGTRMFGLPSQFLLSLGLSGPKQGLKRMLGRQAQIGLGRAMNAWGEVAGGLDDIYRDSNYGWFPLQKAVIDAAASHNIALENIAKDWKPLLSKIVARLQSPGSVQIRAGDRIPMEGVGSAIVTKEDMQAARVMTEANNAIRRFVSQNKQFQELIDNPLKIVDKDLGIYRYVVAVKYLMENPRTFSSEGNEFARKWLAAKDAEITPEGETEPGIERRLELMANNEHVLNDYWTTSNPQFTQSASFKGDELTRKAHAERVAAQKLDPSTDLNFYKVGKLTAVDEYADWLGRYKAAKNNSDVATEIANVKKELVAAFDSYVRGVQDEANPTKTENESSPVNIFANSARGPLTVPRGTMVAPDFFYDYTTVTHTNYGNLRGKAMLPFIARVQHELTTTVDALRAAVEERKAYLKTISPPGAFSQFRGKRLLRKEEIAKAKAGAYVASLKELTVALRMAESEKDRLTSNLAKARDVLYDSTAIDLARRAESLATLPLLFTPSATINNMMSAVFGSALIDTLAGNTSWYRRFPMEILKMHARVMKGTALVVAKSKPLDAVFKKYPRLFRAFTNLILHWTQQEAAMAQINRDAGVGNKLNVLEHIEAIKRDPATYGDIESRDLNTLQRGLNRVMAALSGFQIGGVTIPGLEGARNWSQLVDNFTLKQVALRIMANLDRIQESMYDAVQARHDGEVNVANWNNPNEPLTPFTPQELGLTSFKDLETFRRWFLPAGNLEALALDYWNRAQAAGGYDAQENVPLLTDAQHNSVVREMFRYSGNPVDEANRITRMAANGGAGLFYQIFTRFQNWAANMASSFNHLTERDLRDKPSKDAMLIMKVLALMMIVALGTIFGNEEKAIARTMISNDEPSLPRLAGVQGAGDFLRLGAASMASGMIPYYGELIARAMGTSANRPLLDLTGAIPLAGIIARMGDTASKIIQSEDPVLPLMDFIRATMPYLQPAIGLAERAGIPPFEGEAASRQASRAIRSAAPPEMEKTSSSGGGVGATLTPMSGIIRRAVDAAYAGNQDELQAQIDKGVAYQMSQGKSEDDAKRSVLQSIEAKTPARKVLGKLPTPEEEATIVSRMTPTQQEDYNRSKEAFAMIGAAVGRPIPLTAAARGGIAGGQRRSLLGGGLFGIRRGALRRQLRGPSLGIPKRRRIMV